MDKKILAALRSISPIRFQQLWEKAKMNDLEGASKEETRIIKILLDHESEYFKEFESSDFAGNREVRPGKKQNFLIHIAIHSLVEAQLDKKDPPEAYRYYLAMRDKNHSHHDAIHLVSAIFTYLMLPVVQHKAHFDMARYKFLLNEYINKEPGEAYKLFGVEKPHESSPVTYH
jgi:hypothetical protein